MEQVAISIVDISSIESDYPYLELYSAGYLRESDFDLEDDEIVPMEKLEKVRMLLMGREEDILEETK